MSIHARDALYGKRGPTYYRNEGNCYMRMLAEPHLAKYNEEKRRGTVNGKRSIVAIVYWQFRAEGRRFMEQVDKNCFEEMSEDKAMDKIQKVFNGMNAKTRKIAHLMIGGPRRGPGRPRRDDKK